MAVSEVGVWGFALLVLYREGAQALLPAAVTGVTGEWH